MYCDFHFSVNTATMDAMVSAICAELDLRRHYLDGSKPIQTVYFGGGTPSLLSAEQLERIFNAIKLHYTIAADVEITLEANPDDLTKDKLQELRHSPINRLSIGVQSFDDQELQFMGRAHDAEEATACIHAASAYGFDNISMDLIYGIPGGGLVSWARNLNQAFSLPIQHLSCYGMTIEPRTKLHQLISSGLTPVATEEAFSEQFGYLIEQTLIHGFEHYEISNFAKPGYRSGHNSRYWNDAWYLGIGPSAHSYNGETRQWNVSSNAAYLDSIQQGLIPCKIERLTAKDKYNEYVMTRLRTLEGVDMIDLSNRFGKESQNYFLSLIEPYCRSGAVIHEGKRYFLSSSGQFIADKVASDLFMIDSD